MFKTAVYKTKLSLNFCSTTKVLCGSFEKNLMINFKPKPILNQFYR